MPADFSKNILGNNKENEVEKNQGFGIVTYSSRRFVDILYNNKTYTDILLSRKLDPVPGDLVKLQFNKENINKPISEVIAIEERKNLLKRSFENKTKLLASNLDTLFIVTAPPPIFNTLSIDRMLCAAFSENIKVVLIANKMDLKDFEYLDKFIEYYKSLDIEVLKSSAKENLGIEIIKNKIKLDKTSIHAFCGVSGAGKSSLLSSIFPYNEIKTGEVSDKTGQGRQTTSAARGYLSDEFNAILIDLPGIQQFGLSHLSIDETQYNMPDIQKLRESCKFNNCMHLKEPYCAVLRALESNKLIESRYLSYKDIIDEINTFNKY